MSIENKLFSLLIIEGIDMAYKSRENNKFLHDEKFVDWIINENSVYKEFWQLYFEENPLDENIAEEAVAIIKDALIAEKASYRNTKMNVKEELWQAIEKQTICSQRKLFIPKNGYRWIAAAIIVVVTIVALKLPISVNSKTNYTTGRVIINSTSAYRLVYLSDGTKINLAPSARLTCKRLFSDNKREVWLNGDAFFEVAKDRTKPFFVYAGDVVVRVVGTSFRISNCGNKNKDVKVEVRTGEVHVYKNGSESDAKSVKVLHPLQRCTYNSSKEELKSDSIVSPVKLNEEYVKNESFVFENASLVEVFAAIEKRFGIPLIFNKDQLGDIHITVTLNDENIETMLKIVCKTTGATYLFNTDDGYITIKK